jgi:hypothetical protein
MKKLPGSKVVSERASIHFSLNSHLIDKKYTTQCTWMPVKAALMM